MSASVLRPLAHGAHPVAEHHHLDQRAERVQLGEFTDDMQPNSGSASRLVKSIYFSAEHARHRLSDVIA